ncbi:hypothetical protein JZM24_01495 [Candidatus Sodalis endolongispinus]|uniref:Uncharacterized protein n=1 Tax=Candidatus Sodalis endolongispinus TaxID=2812662 RepID=A0ABS5Y889_9GAMM|nr:hypothetical protein [Candidatus Sodalis endolongispinus]MBT9431163.1 hypothetical protein [Candidatus Sodalis endolongispinus]
MEPKCWLLEIPDGDCDIHVRWANESTRLALSAGWRGMLLMQRLNLALRAGTARHQELPLFALAKLQVFIDESRGVQVDYAQQQWAQVELDDYPNIGTCADNRAVDVGQLSARAIPDERAGGIFTPDGVLLANTIFIK